MKTRDEIIKVLKKYADPLFRKDWSVIPQVYQDIADELLEQPDKVANCYPDTEANGYVFCGKCGKMK